MCQEKNVVAIARVKEGGKEGTFWYVINGEAQKAIISDKLQLNQAMKEVLNRTKIQKIDQNPFGRQQIEDIITIGNESFSYSAYIQNSDSYNNKLITFLGDANTITF